MNELAEYKAKLSKIEDRFVQLTDKDTFEKECSFALQHFSKNPYLAGATTESKLEAVLNIAQIGLTLNPVLKLAYLVPRRKGNDVVCHLEPSYQGLVKLITDTGSATTVYSHCVYEGDEFEVALGTSTEITHKPKFKSKVITVVYAVAILPDGTKQVDVMPISDVHEIRNSSESYKAYLKKPAMSCIWVKHEGEMAKKTVVKRLVKYLPKTDKWAKMGHAIDLTNKDFECSVVQMSIIEGLLMEANLTEEEKTSIYNSIEGFSFEEANKTIHYLKENQVSSITHSANPTNTEIAKEINEIINEEK